MSLKEIQNIEFEILEYFKQECCKNNLPFIIVAGTLLGAVRHKGFIPWDDDIDVYMNYKDFKKFKKLKLNNDYFLQTPKTDIQMPYVAYKLQKKDTYLEENINKNIDVQKGIFIDIFTYVNAARYNSLIKIQRKLYKLLSAWRCKYLYKATRLNPNKIRVLFTKLPDAFQVFIDSCLIFSIQLLGSRKSKYYFCISWLDGILMPKEYYADVSLYTFNNEKFYGPKDFDGYLTMIYGDDYMTPIKWDHHSFQY